MRDTWKLLHLPIDWDVAKSLAIRIESAEPRSLQSTDRGEIARREFFALGKFRESGEDFVAFGKNHGKGFFAARVFSDHAGLQSGSATPIRDRPGRVYPVGIGVSSV